MNNRKGEKSSNQLSLSQSLLRKKTRKLESTTDKTALNETDGNPSNLESSEDISFFSKTKNTSHSQPENNDFDDSFDLFLPRKSPPKKFLTHKVPSSQSSFFDVKKTKKSRYFGGRGQLQVPKVIKDDDLELAIAVSLQESKGSAVNLKPVKSTSGPAPRGGKLKKACSQSLLMRRSAADRERIITEKVAIVLMSPNKISAPTSPVLEPRQPRLLYSAFLNERFNTLNTLWNLSQADLAKVPLERFYTNIMLYYVDTPFRDRHATDLDASNLKTDSEDGSGDLQLVSDDDMFASSGDESCKGPSPKRPRSDELSCSPQEDNVCSFNASNKSETELRTRSWEVSYSDNTHNLSAISAANVNSGSIPKVSNASGENHLLRVETSDLATMETTAEDCIKSPLECDAKTPLKEVRTHEAAVDRSISANRSSPTGSLFADNHGSSTFTKHQRKLCADFSSLSNSDFSSIIKIHKGSETLYAHGCVFEARCPVLLDALVKNSGCLDEFSLEVCQAVFGYIYAGNIEKALALKLREKRQLIECCLRFDLGELAEELFPENDEGKDVSSSAGTDTLLAEPPCEEAKCSAGVRKVISGTQSELTVSRNEVTEPEKFSDVILLDSDCCSAEEILSSEPPAGEASDDELDLYLKDGVRLLEKNSPIHSSLTPTAEQVGDGGSPSKIIKEPKRSIERYFQDSFPSLDGIITPKHESRDRPKGPIPCSSEGIRNCVTPGGQLVVSELATPIPDYESMVSPDLKEALQKYGIKKGIGRRKAVTLLRYIYDQIHPPSDHPAVAKAIDDIKAKSTPPAPDSDSDVYTLSSDSSGDEAMFEDLGDVFHTQAEAGTQETPAKPGLLREVGTYIKSNTLLYAAVLKYEPIWLNKFHHSMKENGVKCNKKELMDVLDELGITFRTEQTEKQLQRKRNKKPTRRKK